MRQESGPSKAAVGKAVKGILRNTRRYYLAKQKIRVVAAGLGGAESVIALYRRDVRLNAKRPKSLKVNKVTRCHNPRINGPTKVTPH